jgi:hypothetical protein
MNGSSVFSAMPCNHRLPRDRLKHQPGCGQCHALLMEGRPNGLNWSSFNSHLKCKNLSLVVCFSARCCS